MPKNEMLDSQQQSQEELRALTTVPQQQRKNTSKQHPITNQQPSPTDTLQQDEKKQEKIPTPKNKEEHGEDEEDKKHDKKIQEPTKQKPTIPDLSSLTKTDLFKDAAACQELKNKLKAILFASGKRLSLEDITKLVKKRDLRPVLFALRELQQEYNTNQHEPLILLDEDQWLWRLTLKEKYVPVVENLVTQTELPKTEIETLAVIAWKAPVTQAEVIRVRTNKAYQHIKTLEEQGFITSEKYGRTRLLKITQKFYEYFDINKDQLKQHLQSLLPEKKKKIQEETIAAGEQVYNQQTHTPQDEEQILLQQEQNKQE
ncbi:MAG: SMC-Scp complex subunit ScpB [Candidatus Woesearchaeota archaeon]